MDSIVAVAACSIAAVFWWILIPLRALQNDRRLESLIDQDSPEPPRWPRLSVVVPAKNEEDSLFEAMQSLLEVDYPDLEIILVDDRSTDRSGEIIDRLERLDDRVRALHIDSLPDGWLGKVHALHRGLGISRGEWVLFTDADIHFEPQILKRAIAYCLQHDRGFLTLFPDFFNVRLLVGTVQAAFGVILLTLLDIARIDDPDSKLAMGIGAFNLFSRQYIDSDEGLEWLRMEIADDAGFGLMMKQRGAKPAILSGQDLIRVDWYPTMAAIMNGVMQRLVIGANYNLVLYSLHCAATLFCVIAPLVLVILLAPVSTWAWLVLLLYLVPSVSLLAGARDIGIPRLSIWGISIGYAILFYGMLRALVTFVRYGGVYWRGTVYPLKELRAMQRVKLDSFVGIRGDRS